MTSSYNEIYSRFFIKVDATMSFLKLSREDLNEFLTEWLHASLAKPYVRRIFKSLKTDNETMTMEFDIHNSVDEDSDKEYVKEIIAYGMAVEWLEPRVKSDETVRQFFGGKEQKWFSQAQHMSEIRGMLSDAKIEIRKLIRDHGYIYNSYLNGD